MGRYCGFKKQPITKMGGKKITRSDEVSHTKLYLKNYHQHRLITSTSDRYDHNISYNQKKHNEKNNTNK